MSTPTARVVEILGVTRDISERKTFEAELTRLAVTDPLTGVWNRRHGGSCWPLTWSRPASTASRSSLLMIDIDHFKPINDTHGHQTGDRVLTEIGPPHAGSRPRHRRRGALGRRGIRHHAARLRPRDAMSIAEKIRAQIADTPFRRVGTVTVSIGAAELRPDDDLEPWLARADAALYDAKRSGRNAVLGAGL